MAKKDDSTPAPDLKLEEALSRLEALVGEMESGRTPLEESLKKFTEGMQLADLCTKKLNDAQQKIEILLRKAENGNAAWGEFAATPDTQADAE